jgi:hypothetical protein
MGGTIAKGRIVEPSQNSEGDHNSTHMHFLAKDTSLESVANETLKLNLQKKSQNKYGFDLDMDEFADDMPSEVKILLGILMLKKVPSRSSDSKRNSITLPPIQPTSIHLEFEDDGYYSPSEREEFALEPTETNSTPFSINWQQGGLIGAGAYGKVYLGLNVDTGELLAVKQVSLPNVGESEYQPKEVLFQLYLQW